MSPSFLVKILCYTWRPFTITLASSAIIYAGRCLILKWLYYSKERVDILNNVEHVIENTACLSKEKFKLEKYTIKNSYDLANK